MDPAGKKTLVQGEDAGDFTTTARIDFTPRLSGTYHLVVTTAQPGETGPYTLNIQGYDVSAAPLGPPDPAGP
jgi:hypothetical protein